jgi:glucosyl-3-phosphoglycerate synthase
MSALTGKRSTLLYAGPVAISVCLPARNEGPTIASIVREALQCTVVDEVVVIDDGSTDATAAIASDAGARVVPESALLPEAGPGSGKGNALWKSLFACTGDLICFLDADLRNFRAEYVERLCAPLMTEAGTALVKASYTRAFQGAPTGGGRVTELAARPLLSLLFPKLADISQPLGREYAARRDVLEQLPFVEGWGVEIGLLIDVVDRYGRDAIAQVDLGMREHRNRTLEELSPQALEVIATALQRAGVGETVAVRERPPIITFPAYRARFDPPR